MAVRNILNTRISGFDTPGYVCLWHWCSRGTTGTWLAYRNSTIDNLLAQKWVAFDPTFSFALLLLLSTTYLPIHNIAGTVTTTRLRSRWTWWSSSSDIARLPEFHLSLYVPSCSSALWCICFFILSYICSTETSFKCQGECTVRTAQIRLLQM